MVISNGNHKITTTSNVNWNDNNSQLKITGGSGMLALSYTSNKSGSIIGYNNSTEHWFIGRGDAALTDIHFGSITNDKVHIRANGANRMTITGSGKVGIGLTNPPEKLSIYDGNIQIENINTVVESILFKHTFTSWNKTYKSQITFDWYGHTYGNSGTIRGLIYLSGRASYANHYFIDDEGNSQLTLLDNKNVGINTLSPSEKLHVASGNAKVEGHIQARDYVEVLDTTGAEGFKMQWNDTDKSIDFIFY
jgi:hypothetical protein